MVRGGSGKEPDSTLLPLALPDTGLVTPLRALESCAAPAIEVPERTGPGFVPEAVPASELVAAAAALPLD
jgi:hypothetical protein